MSIVITVYLIIKIHALQPVRVSGRSMLRPYKCRFISAGAVE